MSPLVHWPTCRPVSKAPTCRSSPNHHSLIPDPPSHPMTLAELQELHSLPFFDLLKRAHEVHEKFWPGRQNPALHAALHQDRRLLRGLRVLRPVRPLQDRVGKPRAAGARGGDETRPRRQGLRLHPLLHGRRLERRARRHSEVRPGARYRPRRRHARHGSLRHPRRTRPGGSRSNSAMPASPPTTTTSTPRRSTIRTSSPPTPTRTACAPSATSRTPASPSAAAASSASAKPSPTASACWKSFPTSTRSPRACRSTRSCRCPARRWRKTRRSIPSISSA